MITTETITAMIAEDVTIYRARRAEYISAAEALVTVYRETRDGTPAETVRELVSRIGYHRAAAVIASLVNRSAWDGRISSASAAWAETVADALDEDAAQKMSISADAIHRAHLDQIARAMMQEPTPAETVTAYRERITAAQTLDDAEQIEHDAARDGHLDADASADIFRRTAALRMRLMAEEDARRAAEMEPETETAEEAAPAAYTAAELVRRITGADALPHRVSITVPGTMGPDTIADEETRRAWEERTARALAARFGGCTSTPGRGSWIDAAGRLIAEPVTVCTAYAAAITPADADAVREIAEALRAGMDQDAVTVEIDGRAGFVERPTPPAA